MRKIVIGSGLGLAAVAALPAQATVMPVGEPAGVTAAGKVSLAEPDPWQRGSSAGPREDKFGSADTHIKATNPDKFRSEGKFDSASKADGQGKFHSEGKFGGENRYGNKFGSQGKFGTGDSHIKFDNQDKFGSAGGNGGNQMKWGQ